MGRPILGGRAGGSSGSTEGGGVCVGGRLARGALGSFVGPGGEQGGSQLAVSTLRESRRAGGYGSSREGLAREWAGGPGMTGIPGIPLDGNGVGL